MKIIVARLVADNYCYVLYPEIGGEQLDKGIPVIITYSPNPILHTLSTFRKPLGQEKINKLLSSLVEIYYSDIGIAGCNSNLFTVIATSRIVEVRDDFIEWICDSLGNNGSTNSWEILKGVWLNLR